MCKLTTIQKEIIKLLRKKGATYAHPLKSQEMGDRLNVTPSYIREQAKLLEKKGVVAVRRGPGGGYFFLSENFKGEWN